MAALGSTSLIGMFRASLHGKRPLPGAPHAGLRPSERARPAGELLSLVQELEERVETVLLAFEFDGVLTQLAPTPQEARLDLLTRSTLERLANSERVKIAVVSGRSLRDLEARVGVPGLDYVGNHGLEIAGPHGTFRHPELEALEPFRRELRERLNIALADLPGALIEDKGASVACHFRIAPASVAEKLMLRAQDLADSYRGKYTLLFGACVVEFQPAVRWSTVDALQWLLGRLSRESTSAPVYVAHERGDLHALDYARANGACAEVGTMLPAEKGAIHLGHVDEVRDFLHALASAAPH